MKKLDLYQIDAFTENLFGGNPACVVPLNSWLPDELMLNIAKENAVAETAFFIIKEDNIHLRWFTPDIEMDLCGHATLATAHALKTILNYPKNELIFITLSGELKVIANNGFYTMDFPSRMPEKAELPQIISEALNIEPNSVLKARDYVLVYDDVSSVHNIKIDRAKFDQINLDPGGVILTAKGENSDFILRFFTPQATELEDPVTGSAHCSLIPYWSDRLNKEKMVALQVSDRGGKLFCQNNGDRVLISGHARTYSVGVFWIE